ncbi:carboxylic ester hydrolase [Favolaschia claudopus]|uniref:Carboxylic ester hydrolase n=1 Tax=Favolaschia claudopus TaxID=2862362 RepID=A0AAV9ZUS4_9AGAR
MSLFKVTGVLFALLHGVVAAAPTIKLDSGTFVGTASSSNTQSFLGIPFAQPPVGDLRFRLPVANSPYTGTHTAVKLPVLSGFPQEVIDFVVNSAFGVIFPSAEDCLTVNVIKPSSATSTSKLPVVVWIFGGGFELGSPSMYDGVPIVQRSIKMGEPVIYVSLNYRVSAFGFLASKEVRAAGVGNLGLQDQRQAFRWVQKYIGAFGGDPSKVTIWGESAGAISASLHMIANNGNHEGLFRGAFMESGSPIPVGPLENGQKYYDAIVKQVGCSSAADTLACLRTVPYSALKAAQDASPFIFSYQSLILAWLPREDGTFLTDAPQKLVQQGKVANVPFVTGDCDDEGTLFSLSTLNVTTDAEFQQYVRTVWLPQASTAMTTTLQQVYPNDITAGSPFGTSILNAATSQFKRLAAFQGDAVFQAPRRFFQQSRSGKQKQWGFISKRLKAVPFLGSFHVSDILNIYFDGELTDHLINFVNKLDPTATLLLFPTTITQDTFRKDAIQFITDLTLQFPI